ncbi:hypothetical protein [Agromyces sp. SYSU T00194]|uniref:hypothetical protein n=1 Tax=Agromyces chitinivorans TaxID=3158560 RepID=UPI00339606CF
MAEEQTKVRATPLAIAALATGVVGAFMCGAYGFAPGVLVGVAAAVLGLGGVVRSKDAASRFLSVLGGIIGIVGVAVYFG